MIHIPTEEERIKIYEKVNDLEGEDENNINLGNMPTLKEKDKLKDIEK